ncbi:ubiquitin carboxyl-terminal hydrolase 15 [[Candida] railenensis]|uniref:ubiquitinyl hydrolase 1 n=1 Tax=[Candida] railenensis TaxID=45579 RepID=A0A9P0QTL6_9ASCO|nr:ubiquitin carboxyl-terminal hydrolase 15 [[Candida] railenensis]
MIKDIQDDDIMEVDSKAKEQVQETEIVSIDDDDAVLVEEIDDDDEEDVDDEVEKEQEAVAQGKQPAVNSFPNAKDFDKLAKKLMKPIQDYPVVEQTHHIWEIKDWNGMKENKIRGPSFECGGYTWNILLFPNGNNNNQLAIYIEPHPVLKGGEEDIEQNDKDWYVCAQFGLDIWNPNYPEAHMSSGSFHRFNKNESDWGFSNFIDLKNLYSNNFLQRHQTLSSSGASPSSNSKPHAILESNQLNITAYVKIIDDSSTGVLWHSFNQDYDSKAATSYVGLNNQGATCYLNSLLQSYYTTKIFRKLVYQIPTDSHVNGKSVPLSLQRIFYQLTNSSEPVGTLELTRSFGWDSSDAFTQHDVQELNRILMDKLESAMKGTKIENSLNPIFVGKMKSYIKCVDVPYESSRVEDFWDIQLNVKGFQNLESAFQNYIEVEMLEGENKYQAGEEYGYQDAKKGVVFESFPPVLHLQLKRFEYDFMIDDLVKIDDYFKFPDAIDLSPYLDEELPKEVKKENWVYKLHGVLVHQGSISNGHYYALIKPSASNKPGSTGWLRFDDDKVWKVTPTQVFYENFGAHELQTEQIMKMTKSEQNEYMIRRPTSAYMLVYYRESMLDEVLPEDSNNMESMIPKHIAANLKAEQEERSKIEKAKQEALYYINVKVVTNKNFIKYNSFDLYPDVRNERFYEPSLFDKDSNPLVIKFKKEDPFRNLYYEIGKTLGLINEDNISKTDIASLPYRLISMNHRNNHTNRSDTPIPEDLLDKPTIQVYHECFNRKYDEMCFFIEEKGKELITITNDLENGLGSPVDFKFADVFDKIEADKKDTAVAQFQPIFDNSSYIMLFIKYFDRVTGELRGLTHVTVLKDENISSLLKPINKLLGFKDTTQLLIFEEVSPSKLEALQVDTSFEKSELSNGDILCVQANEVIPNEVSSVSKYYKFLFTRFHVISSPFHPNESEEDSDFVDEQPSDVTKKDDKTFDFWISIQSSYLEFATEIAKRIDANPAYLRIFAVNNQNVKFPLKRLTSIQQIFGKTVNASQITKFEYELLNIPLEEYENMKLIKFNWLTSLVHFQTFELLVPRKGLVGEDLMQKILHKIQVSEESLPNILIWSGVNHKYVDIIKFDREISTIPDNFELYGAVLPAEVETLVNYDMVKRFEGKIEHNSNECATNENSHVVPPDAAKEVEEIEAYELEQVKNFNRKLNMIPGFHFYKNSSYHHGIPFIFPVFPGEKFVETRARLRAKMGLGRKEFDKIKFALADLNDKGRYIDHENDEFVLYDEIKKHQEQLSLALDHPDRSARRQTQFDRGISIK